MKQSLKPTRFLTFSLCLSIPAITQPMEVNEEKKIASAMMTLDSSSEPQKSAESSDLAKDLIQAKVVLDKEEFLIGLAKNATGAELYAKFQAEYANKNRNHEFFALMDGNTYIFDTDKPLNLSSSPIFEATLTKPNRITIKVKGNDFPVSPRFGTAAELYEQAHQLLRQNNISISENQTVKVVHGGKPLPNDNHKPDLEKVSKLHCTLITLKKQ